MTGFPRQPKWGHLKDLHAAIKLCSHTILSGVTSIASLGQQQEAYTYNGESGKCAAFLVNNDNATTVVVQFQNSSYELPPTSISILPDCKNVAFNTAKATAQCNERLILPMIKFDSADEWSEFKEVVPIFEETTLRSNSLLEHMNTTKDRSDYLWYTVR